MKKKVLLPILLLAAMTLTGCNQPNSSADSKQESVPSEVSSDTTQYGVAIANKEALQGEWYANTTRDLDVTLTPAANPLSELGKNLSVTSSDPEVVAVTGLGLKSLKAGKATITVKYHEATDSVEVTILDKKPAPAKVNAKPSEVMAADDAIGKVIYHVEGYVINWGTKTEWTQYGEMTIGDTADSTEGMYVYGSYVEGVTFDWDGVEKYSIKYTNRDVLTNELTKNLHIGDKVTMDVIRSDYNTTKEVKGQILAVEKGAFVEATGVEAQLNGKAVTTLSLRAKENKLLKAVIAPENASENATWISSDETVATVKDGFVKALKAGTATITAKVNDKIKAEVALTVENEYNVANAGTQAAPYTVDEAIAVVGGLDLRAFTEDDIFVKGVVLTSSYSSSYKNYTIWLADSQDNKAFEVYAGVFAKDAVTAEQEKEYQKTDGLKGFEIVVSGKGQFYDNTLEITREKQADGSYIYPQILSATKATGTPTAIDAKDVSVTLGGDAKIESSFVPFYATGTLTYQSANEEIAKVDADGKVTGVAVGETTITITCGTITKDIKVTVADKDPLTETVALSFKNREESNGTELKTDDSNKSKLANDTVLEFFQKAGEKGSHVTAVKTSTKVYSGSGTGGAFPNSKGLIKFGSSSAAGELSLVLDGKADKVVINCQSFNDNDTVNTISVNGSEAQNAPVATEINKGSDLTFELESASDVITIKSGGKFRVLVYSITISCKSGSAELDPKDYVNPIERTWTDGTAAKNSDGKDYIPLTDASGKVGVKIKTSDVSSTSAGAYSSGKLPSDGKSVTYQVKAPKAGNYQMVMTAKVSADYKLSQRGLAVTVNGKAVDIVGDRDGGLVTTEDKVFVVAPIVALTGEEDTITLACPYYRIVFNQDAYVVFGEI